MATPNLSDRDDFLPESLLLSNGEGSSDNGEEVSDEAQGEVQSPGTVRGSSQDARFSSPLVNSPKMYPTRSRRLLIVWSCNLREEGCNISETLDT